MVKEGTVIKVNSRPVYYLNRLVLEQKYHMQIEKNEYLSILELTKEIEKFVSKESDFDKAIGNEGSLSYCIAQIKSALLYPGGLPILLKGEMGSGKTFLMKLIQEYCVCLLYTSMFEGTKCCIITQNGIMRFKGDLQTNAVEVIPARGINRYLVMSADELRIVYLVK